MLALVPITAWAQVSAPTLLSLSASARVERAPDLAEISAGVVTMASSATAAAARNADAMTRVIAALRAARVADRDIQTAGVGLQPQYAYEQGQAPRLTGYQATNSAVVRLRDLPRAGAVIDALVGAGANQIGGPTFKIADEDAALDVARGAAIAKARARAELYARAAGLRVARIARIAEAGAEPPRPMPMMSAMSARAESTPIAPGEVALTAEVTVDFELE